jgi:hypothetical protein
MYLEQRVQQLEKEVAALKAQLEERPRDIVINVQSVNPKSADLQSLQGLLATHIHGKGVRTKTWTYKSGGSPCIPTRNE